MDVLRQEFRYALRSLRNTPLASTVVVLTLAVGIALVTTFFSLVNTQLLHPLPYKHADRTISLTPYAVRKMPIDELRSLSRALTGVATVHEDHAILSGSEGVEQASVAQVDTALFQMLDERPILGSLPSAREIADEARVVVINEKLWQRRFATRADVIGRTLIVDRIPRTIVAVMPSWFTFPNNAEAWYPLDRATAAGDRSLLAIGSLAPGHDIDDVTRELQLLGARLHMIDSSTYHVGRTGGLYAQTDMVERGRGKGPMMTMVLLVVGGAVCVLLVACTNVASLMLARAARRRAQMVIRASLGASRWQLMRQQLVESLLLASAAGVIGTLLSVWGIQLVLAMVPPQAFAFFPGWVHFGLDVNVLAFAAGVSLLTIAVFGVWPAREGTRFDLSSALRRSADPSLAGRDPTRRLHLPVVLELTLSVTLFVAALMMVRSFHYLATTDRGFAIADRSSARLAYDDRDSIPADYSRFVVKLRDALQAATPSIGVALESRIAGFLRDSGAKVQLRVPETGRVLSIEDMRINPLMISDNYFRVLGLRVLAGRAFDSTDAQNSGNTIIVSKQLATDVWGSENPLGKQLIVSSTRGTRATVIGVASDRLESSRGESGALVPSRDIYFSARQAITCCNRAEFIVHSHLTSRAIASLFDKSIAGLGRQNPVTIETFAEREARMRLLPWMLSLVLGTFALAGLILAIMGIYGVVAFTVEQRTREIGIRMALGANGRDVTRHLMRGGMQLVGTAIAIGLAAAGLAGKLLTAFVVGTLGMHLVTAVAVAVLFGLIALAACYLPARRAAALDPLKALRTD